MKSTMPFPPPGLRRLCASLIGACLAVSGVSAAETNAPATAEPSFDPKEAYEGGAVSFNNWVELSVGGFFNSGSTAQFQQRHRTQGGPFGGIEDFHYTTNLSKGTTLTADGRAIFDNGDYRLRLELTREKLGYLRLDYSQFRTWYNGNGGFDAQSDSWYPRSGDALALDRGEVSFEAGLRLDKVPKITFRYTHRFRDGDKSSTIWGTTHPGGGLARGLSPSSYDIDERSDIFQIDVSHQIKKTEIGGGLRYETSRLDDALKITQSPGEPGVERKITDRQDTSYDLFNAHAYTETWFKNNLMFSSGFSFSDVDSDFSGSRIYGNDFDVAYAPDPANGSGYFGLNGSGHTREYVLNLNLLTIPIQNLTIVPSVRVQREDIDADFTGMQTLGDNAPVPFDGNSDRNLTDVRERLDLRYSGVTNWVFYTRGEWTEGQGNLRELGGTGLVNGTGVPPIQRKTEDERFFQKYSAGARWYPTRRVTLDAGAYYKVNDYDYDNSVDNTANNSGNRYPAYLVMQNFETWDANVGLTLRPLQNVTLVSRYEYQRSTVRTKPDPISGLSEVESADMKSHIISQNISWVPWSRLALQLGFNYVLSELDTPAADFTQTLLNAQNNYWTINFNSSLVLDDKTDLILGYFYYRADDYHDISLDGVSYGTGAEEHGITATLVRRLTKQLRLRLKYGYYRYTDALAGGHNDYQAHVIFSALQYRF